MPNISSGLSRISSPTPETLRRLDLPTWVNIVLERLTGIASVAFFGKLVPGLQVPDDKLSVICHPPEVYLVDERDELSSLPFRHGSAE